MTELEQLRARVRALECGPPRNVAQPDPFIITSEKATPVFTSIENGALIPDRIEGFVPTLIWLSYAPMATGVTVVAPHRMRIDLVAGADPTSITAPQYTLVNGEIVFFTMISDGYHGIALPFLGGATEPYQIRITSGADIGVSRQLRACWGYRARMSIPPRIGEP